MSKEIIRYRNGGEGCCQWIEENCCVPIYPNDSDIPVWTLIKNLPKEPHPKTGKSYWTIWNEQKKILKEALQMEDGRFKYALIVFCWMRGDGKSLLACLVQLWKFFNFPRQQIMLGANSRDQVKFVHYDIMKDIILHSPNLLRTIGKKNIQEKEIRFRDGKGNIQSIIRSISSFSGIVSNITGYTFSEIFDMKNPKFFVQLDGSIRNIPNALGVIDSTVSTKDHVLYELYSNWKAGKLRKVFFSYRFSKLGLPEDYWNPNMDEDQLNDYRIKFPFGEFERYFLNLWSAGTIQIFSDEVIEEIGILGVDDGILNHSLVKKCVEEVAKLNDVIDSMVEKGFHDGVVETDKKISAITCRYKKVDDVYSLKDEFGNTKPATVDDLKKLGDLLNTDWCILGGLDMGDPMAVRGLARTVVSVMAKGLPGSRGRVRPIGEGESPKYVYFILHLEVVPGHSIDRIKDIFEQCHSDYDGIDVICSERYGAWDMVTWCEERKIEFEPIFPNYDRQREAFKEYYTVLSEGRLKCPTIAEGGSKSEDIYREELRKFDHDPAKRWFGSPEKFEKYGVQDDSIYSTAWCMYGGRLKNPDDFRPRDAKPFFGLFIPDNSLIGNYR